MRPERGPAAGRPHPVPPLPRGPRPAAGGRPQARPDDRASSWASDEVAHGSSPLRSTGRGRVEPARPEPTGSRLRGSLAVLAMLLMTLLTAVVDSYLSTGLGLITTAGLVIAAALATLLVRRRDLATVVVSPPLVYIAAALIGTALTSSVGLAGIATLLIRGFPAMALATGAALVIALLRMAARR